MANDPSITLVLTGTLLNGNTELYNALNGKKAVIIGNGVTPADFTTPAGEAFVAGAPGVLRAWRSSRSASSTRRRLRCWRTTTTPVTRASLLIMAPMFAKGRTFR